MRLNRGDNRQINRALRTIATVQAAHHAPAQAYLIRKQARREAIRALKRQLVRTVFRRLREGAEGLQKAG